MRKLTIITLLTLTLAAVWTVWPNEEAEAFTCLHCLPGATTLPAWGMGTSCQAAIDDAIALAESQIPATCDTCDITPIEVTPCHLCGTDPNDPDDCIGANDYRADYKVSYDCLEDLCVGIGPPVGP
ncbi:MAG: hypothetical protein AAF657_38805 [Acidobacteriota bacterium]